jgi:cobalamin biosynthesis protein CobT
VTFHPLADDLTRVLLSMRYYPQGLFEKTGNIWRAGGRRARLDLKNYRTFITSEGKETGSWRGEIHDGQVTAQPEDEEQEGQENEGQDQQSPNGAQAQSQDGRQQSEDGSGGSEGEQGSDDGSGEQAQDEGQQDQSEQREDESVSS